MPNGKLEPGLIGALGLVAEAARVAREPWWVIGSAAMALHGAAPITVRDIDLLMSRGDAARLLEAHGIAPAAGAPSAKFRSDVFGQLELGGYTVEVLGGFRVHDGTGWDEVLPESRVPIPAGAATLFVPSVEDLMAMCRLFGREKDAERERLLRTLALP